MTAGLLLALACIPPADAMDCPPNGRHCLAVIGLGDSALSLEASADLTATTSTSIAAGFVLPQMPAAIAGPQASSSGSNSSASGNASASGSARVDADGLLLVSAGASASLVVHFTISGTSAHVVPNVTVSVGTNVTNVSWKGAPSRIVTLNESDPSSLRIEFPFEVVNGAGAGHVFVPFTVAALGGSGTAYRAFTVEDDHAGCGDDLQCALLIVAGGAAVILGVIAYERRRLGL